MRAWLAAARKGKRLTQSEVANQARISRAYYTQIEQNVRMPSVHVAKAIADCLELNWILFFDDGANNMPAGVK